MERVPKVAAIILNYQGGHRTLECLRSLDQSTLVPETIVVDNASTDGSTDLVEAYFPETKLLRNERNLGFAGGMNVGIRIALERGADFVWLLNQDAVVAPQALSFLIERAERYPEEGLWSPAIFTPDGRTPWFLGGKISFFRMRTVHLSRLRRGDEPFSSEYLTGCALLISRSVLLRAGFLDERYFLYYEDAAYSLAARRIGFHPVVVPKARVFHAETSRNNPEKVYWLVRSGIRFFRRLSPWYWRPWVEIFLSFRQAKNRIDLWIAPTSIVQSVARAYTDASGDR